MIIINEPRRPVIICSPRSRSDYLARYFRFGNALLETLVKRAWVTRYLDHPPHYALLLLPLERGKQQDILRAFTRKPLVSWSILDPTSHALSISPISQSWLLLALPVTFVCGRIASNVCVQISCVCRAIQCRAVSFLVSTSGEKGRGAITCRLLALQSPIVNQEIPEGGMAEVGRGKEEMERPNKVVSIFMSF